MTSLSSAVLNVVTLFKHKGHEGLEGKTYEIRVLLNLCALTCTAANAVRCKCGVLRG